jgi:C-terminal processing protease CtpA/Prc
MKRWTLLLALTAYCHLGIAQPAGNFADSNVLAVLKVFQDNYVFPELAAKAANYVRQKMGNPVYQTITTPDELAAQLTKDLRSITKDLHVSVSVNEGTADEQRVPDPEDTEFQAWLKNWMKEMNYGIKEKSTLPGNIGYINFTAFGVLEYCADSLISAMQQVAETDALIIDLRENRGSVDESTIPFLAGYFFRKPTHINSFYNRLSNDTTQSWSYGWVPGKRYLKKPVYILTSRSTFSGGEEFAYDFKYLKRATIIGDTTRGGANPGRSIRANAMLSIFVPTGRAINPISHTNWEDVGVAPDTVVKSSLALHKAQEMALQQLIQIEKNEQRRKELEILLAAHSSYRPEEKKIVFQLQGFDNAMEVYLAGSFNGWSPSIDRLKRTASGWELELTIPKGRHLYKFVVDGKWITDPANTAYEGEGQSRNSVLEVR